MKDPRIEQVLEAMPNLTWSYTESIPVSRINRRKSHANQARISEPLNAEKVKEYKNSMIAGDKFPASVFFIDGEDYVTSDGNHRNEAVFELGNETQDAYLVVCDDPVVRTALTFEWNAINGWTSSDEDRDRQLVFLVKQGMTLKDAARSLHISAKRAEDVMAEDVGHNRAISLGVKSPWAKVSSRASRIRLTRDIPLDSVFVVAVRHAARFEMPYREIKTFVDGLPRTSEGEQLTYVNTESRRRQRDLEIAKGKRNSNHRGQTPRVLFDAHLAYIAQKVTKGFDLVTFGLNTEEIEILMERVIETRLLLQEAEKQMVLLLDPVSA